MTATLTTVYGGQFGSEGKGQIVAYLAEHREPGWAVRVGGPNAGHTFKLPANTATKTWASKAQVVQTIPSPAFFGWRSIIGPAGFIIEDILVKEAKDAWNVLGYAPTVLIDSQAVIINDEHMAMEAGGKDDIKTRIGSTGEGVGAASADKIWRTLGILVRDHADRLREGWQQEAATKDLEVVQRSSLLVNQYLARGDDVIVEGTQGVGLSLHTSGFYPYCTSRECTPQGILGQAGIAAGVAKREERIMVCRTYPIRVGGNSGDLSGEITWEQLKKATHGYVDEPEVTTVTKKKRRIAKIDLAMLRRNAILTNPTGLALTFFDYWFPEIAETVNPSDLTRKHWAAINHVEETVGVPVKYLSTGFGTVIPLRVNQ